jgi:hypothetical protein
MGFALPLDNWLRKDEIVNFMNPIMSSNSNIIDAEIMKKYWNEFLNRESVGSEFAKIWSLYSLQCFLQRNNFK